MKIGLFDVDSKIPNLALMKLSAYHKQKGDTVEFYSPLFHSDYDKIYASKIFTFKNRKDGYLRFDMDIGGSGINLQKKLPEEIEHIYPDYELYNCNYALGYLTRGCIRDCGFCIVRDKEGYITKHSNLNEFWKGQEKILLLDNNFLAYSHHLEELHKLIETHSRIDFNQGLDIRLITKKNAKLLSKLKRWNGIRYRFALDSPKIIPLVEKKLKLLNSAGISNGSIQFYILIGYNTTQKEDMKRVQFLKEKGCAIYVMPYEITTYVKKFTRWVNRYFYKYETFQEYLDGVRT